MKKTILIKLFLAFVLINGSFAQNQSVESARVAFITQKIGLTPVQAEKFWPIFNEYNSRKKDTRKTIRVLFKKLADPAETNNENLKQTINQISSLKQEQATLEKEYYNRYLIILTPRQLADLLLAEREFQKILIKKVSEE